MDMASIFTFNDEPVRVASPWLQGPDSGSHTPSEVPLAGNESSAGVATASHDQSPSSAKVTRLQAEPQEGPVEYKLHLLLRPRRKFRSTSTGNHLSGSKHSKYGSSKSSSRSVSEPLLDPATPSTVTPPLASTQQTRQHRLQQLTTQLLWRLQQSSPHHTSRAPSTILPSLPEALPELQVPQQPDKLLHGLEESQGALYEIGVSDDGALVGLAEDEMNESINNLRAMAACLGCTVEVLRREVVGEADWLDHAVIGGDQRKLRRSGKLVVAEAFVKPFLQPASPTLAAKDQIQNGTIHSVLPSAADIAPPTTDQLRITLTGPTMSGKSSLLGVLTTSTLDNGRGSSRLSMLRHSHERSSGLTSSVTQELLGYRDAADGTLDVVNYATANVASWVDIHDTSAGSRLALISDSAGHPRYRRTTVRGLVGWAPHWTLLCIPATDSEDSTGSNGGSASAQHFPVPSDMDLSGAQLDLCLRLALPLVIVITKLDLASRTGLKQTLTKVLDALKAAGRKPAMLPNKSGAVTQDDIQTVETASLDAAYHASLPLLHDPTGAVPIVLTSAVHGTGIGNLRALLRELPIADLKAEDASDGAPVFDIEDIYTKPAEIEGVIVSGRLRKGQISVGDILTIGPFSNPDSQDDSEDSDERSFRRNSSHLPTSRSFPGALRNSLLVPPIYQLPNQEWRRVRVVSIRNLRLPVHTLHADHIGTIAITLEDNNGATSSALHRLRKGMVLAKVQPIATRTFTAQFKREDLESLGVGNHVIVYISSVRASARVVSARAPDSPKTPKTDSIQADDAIVHHPFSFDDLDGVSASPKVAGTITASDLLVTFSFDAAKEFVMTGDRILIMPGGGQGQFGGLEGFVGVVTDTRG
ncbi:hypothetical protein AC579_3377 [Pseudocercospora musae]|uniref:Tr-type G domain-containing protein n=1 Tax=Pseudocercospora musae TaxID=113226 RepID=A0A139ILR0_9PEZI|nr:hypothetical protein AC579_3377 [Pseudocercospora musae]